VRYRLAFVAALLATLAVPTSAPAAVLRVPVPVAGDVSVAHASFKGKPRAVRVANRRLLGGALTVVGGVRRGLVSVVVVRRPSGSAGDATVNLRLPKGRVSRRRVVQSVIAKGRRPPYCAMLPRSFRYARALFGRPLPGFSAADTAKFASFIGCRTFARQNEFLASFDGGTSSEGGGGGGSGELPPNASACDREETPEEQEACEEREAAARAPTVRGSGTVTRTDDPRRFGYSISFDQPVTGYQFSGVGPVYCPASTAAAWYDSCPAEANYPPGSGLRCEVFPGSTVFEFDCGFPPGPDGEPPDTTIPAGQTITGIYLTEPDQPPPTNTSVGLIGRQGSGGKGPRVEIPVS
jgi:hypothetical protein